MSELQTKIEGSFKEASKKLGELNEELNKIADLEQEIASLSSNLQLSSNGLRKLTKDHADYLQRVDELNSLLRKVGEGLSEVKPAELERRLNSVESEVLSMKSQLSETEKAIKAAINRLFKFVVLGVLAACGLVYIALGF